LAGEKTTTEEADAAAAAKVKEHKESERLVAEKDAKEEAGDSAAKLKLQQEQECGALTGAFRRGEHRIIICREGAEDRRRRSGRC